MTQVSPIRLPRRFPPASEFPRSPGQFPPAAVIVRNPDQFPPAVSNVRNPNITTPAESRGLVRVRGQQQGGKPAYRLLLHPECSLERHYLPGLLQDDLGVGHLLIRSEEHTSELQSQSNIV